MNQKVLRYLLSAGIVVVWGTIAYRIVKGLNGEDGRVQGAFKTSKFDYNLRQDTFSLIADYPDPFLPRVDSTLREDDTAFTPRVRQTDLRMTQVSKPAVIVQFFGMISNPEKKKKVAIISISGKEYMATEKQKIDNVLISKITKEKITVSIDGKSQQIVRQTN